MKRIYPEHKEINKFFDDLRNSKVDGLTKEESKEYWHNILDFPSCSDRTKCPKCSKEYTTTTCFCIGQIKCDCGYRFYDGDIRKEGIKQMILLRRKNEQN